MPRHDVRDPADEAALDLRVPSHIAPPEIVQDVEPSAAYDDPGGTRALAVGVQPLVQHISRIVEDLVGIGGRRTVHCQLVGDTRTHQKAGGVAVQPDCLVPVAFCIFGSKQMLLHQRITLWIILLNGVQSLPRQAQGVDRPAGVHELPVSQVSLPHQLRDSPTIVIVVSFQLIQKRDRKLSEQADHSQQVQSGRTALHSDHHKIPLNQFSSSAKRQHTLRTFHHASITHTAHRSYARAASRLIHHNSLPLIYTRTLTPRSS